MKLIFRFFAGLAVAGASLQASESQPINDAFLRGLRAEAARAHPAVMAGKSRARAAAHEVQAVRLWEDPMMGFGLMAASKAVRRDDGDVIIGIEQTLPKRGLFEAERRRSEAVVRAEQESARSWVHAAGAEAARAAIELALADESIALQAEQVHWMKKMVENASQLAADPTGVSTDALRLETELAKEQEILNATRRNRKGYAEKLNIALGRSLEAGWPTLKLPASPPPVPIASAEIARIRHSNPQIHALREIVGAAHAETEIADRERAPEVSVGLDAQLYSGRGDITNTTVGVKLNLPWFNEPSYQAKIDAAKKREDAAKKDVDVLLRQISSRVSEVVTEATNAAAQARAYSGEIHEKALKATEITESAWISSSATLTDLLDASRMLFAIRLEQRRMIAMQLAALEELETLVPNR